MDKCQLEKEFIGLAEEYKQVIYKVCYIYATDAEHLNGLYQEVVINRLRQISRMELLVVPLLGGMAFVGIFFIHHHYRSTQQMLFDLLVLIVVVIASYLGYKFIDKRSVDEIEKGLREEFERE